MFQRIDLCIQEQHSDVLHIWILTDGNSGWLHYDESMITSMKLCFSLKGGHSKKTLLLIHKSWSIDKPSPMKCPHTIHQYHHMKEAMSAYPLQSVNRSNQLCKVTVIY